MENSRLFPTYAPISEDSLSQLGARGNYILTQHGWLLDMNSGCWHVPLGHGRSEVREAMQCSYAADPYFGYHPHMLRLADELCRRTGYDRVLFAVSGSDAMDAALRLAWQCSMSKDPERRHIVALSGGYSGATAATHAASGYPDRRTFIPVGFDTYCIESWAVSQDCSRVRDHLETQAIPWNLVSAFVFEPVQGEAGVRHINPAAYGAITERVHGVGGLIIADEIATGMGRTGTLFATERLSPRPDVLCIGKGLTNGEFPLSAVLMTDDVWRRIEASTRLRGIKYLYGHTHAAHPAGCLAALTVLNIMNDSLLAEVCAKGEVLGEKLRMVATRHPTKIMSVRGSGLFWGLELTARRTLREQIPARLITRGVRIVIEGYTAMLVPPFTITIEEIVQVCNALDEALST